MREKRLRLNEAILGDSQIAGEGGDRSILLNNLGRNLT